MTKSCPHTCDKRKAKNNWINWIQDFLSDRTQAVKYNGITSISESVRSDIPRGSLTVIGPVSFLSYINDLPDEVISRIFVFADDTKFYRKIMNHSDVQLVQSDLNILDSWSKKVAFTVSPQKMFAHVNW